MKVGEILLEMGVITEAQLADALKESKRSGEFLGATLIRLQMIDEQILLEALSKQFDLPYYPTLRDIEVPESVINRVPVKFVWHYKFMPLSLNENTLKIAF